MDIVFRIEDIEFVWDERKSLSNLKKHGVVFEEAAEAFFDPFRRVGDATKGDEQRQFVMGYSLSQRLLLVVLTERKERVRIISARSTTRGERKYYEEK